MHKPLTLFCLQSEQAYASSIAMRGTDSQYGLNFCESKNANLDLWIADADGSLRPQGLSGSGQGTLLTNMDHLVNFVDPNQCQESPSDCTTYCNACFRSVIVSMSKTPIKYRLKVCLASDHGNCVYFNSFDTTQNSDNGNTRWYAHLPPGKYVGHLVDSNGKYVEKDLDILMSAEMCSGAIQQDDFTLVTEPLEGGKDPAPAPTPAPGLRPTRSPVRGVPEEETDSDDGYDYDDGNVEEVAETDGYDDDEEEEEEEEADEADEEEEAEEEEESNCKGLFCGMGNK